MSYEARDYAKNPPGEEFQIYVKSNRVTARDRRLRDKREQTAAKRAAERSPEVEKPVSLSANAEEKLKRALESSRG